MKTKLAEQSLANAFRGRRFWAKFVGRPPGARVDKGEGMSLWENTGREEDFVPIMGTTIIVGERKVEGEQ